MLQDKIKNMDVINNDLFNNLNYYQEQINKMESIIENEKNMNYELD